MERQKQAELPKTYSPQDIEDWWYSLWKGKGYFKPRPGQQKKTYSIVMPPPNVTGKLHMGHGLDNTCQDILTRFKRMKGFETLWIPGCDHAGIATQSVIEKKLYQEEKKTRHDIGREKFVQMIWEWKDSYEKQIKTQLEKIGVSADWDYFTFTMDPMCNDAVKRVFVDWYNEGLIYQSDYIVNWSPKLQSAISDAEVEHEEVKGAFYHIHYKVKDSDEVLEVATTRPETLFGDTAVAVHPKDKRYKHLIGKKAIVPLCNREVSIIADDHVDLEMGTGCLKVTPGHDFNDFEIGQRHNLPIVNILNLDGTLNNEALEFAGLRTKEARAKVAAKLKEIGQLVKEEEYTHQVGHCSRTHEIIEPMVSKQWFLNVTQMAKDAVTAIEKNKTTFFPKNWENTYFSWLRNPKDWCISRQLWWGHQIPVFYCQDCSHQWASIEDVPTCPQCKSNKTKQDPDVLDTWFSSGLWPLSTLGWPNPDLMKERKFDKFFPNDTLITGFDIIFFWVARMMMMSLKSVKKAPFAKIYIHGIVRDKYGRKMSKSLGNGIDPMDIVAQYGADAMRFTLAAGSGYNRGINLDPERIEGYRNFINKIWNAFRFIHPHLSEAKGVLPPEENLSHHDRWILSELNTVTKEMNEALEEFRFDEASSKIYSFTYDKFCSWFIELSKPILYGDNEEQKKNRTSVLKYVFKKMLALLHPIVPFITEEIWDYLKEPEETLLIIQGYPEYREELNFPHDQEFMGKFIEVITIVRNLRARVQIKPKDEIKVELFTDNQDLRDYYGKNAQFAHELARVKDFTSSLKNFDRPKKAITEATAHTEVYLPLEGVVDLDAQIARINKNIATTEQELQKVNKKLQNKGFIDKAPFEVVQDVKHKAQDFEKKLEALKNSLQNFK